MNLSVLKRLFYVTSVIVIACVIASGVIMIFTADDTKAEKTSVGAFVESNAGYVLGAEGGVIVAYRKGEEKPFIHTTTPVNSLPYDVQKRLSTGIEYKTRQELNAVLHEYCS
ncbi:MAG: hypothetical protein Q4D44_02585 [Eubacteriales bacterium]|nr:hypothetical protein [Eubacteriales bacterium]